MAHALQHENDVKEEIKNDNGDNNNKNDITNIQKLKIMATQIKDKTKTNAQQFAEASKTRLSIKGQLKQARISLEKYINPRFLKNSIPEDTFIPKWVLKKAKGVVFLTVLKGGFIFAGNIGTGVVIVRDPNKENGWTGPSSIMMAGVSFGLLAGATKVDYILILTDDKAVKQFTGKGQLRLGGELQVALGPIGRQGHASIGAGDKGVSFILSYSHSKGLYGGLELDGHVLTVRSDCNQEFYGTNISCEEILTGKIVPPPNEDYETIVHLLDSYCEDDLTPNQDEKISIDELANDSKSDNIKLNYDDVSPGSTNDLDSIINADENNNNNNNNNINKLSQNVKLSFDTMSNKIGTGFNKMKQKISQNNLFSNNKNNENSNEVLPNIARNNSHQNVENDGVSI